MNMNRIHILYQPNLLIQTCIERECLSGASAASTEKRSFYANPHILISSPNLLIQTCIERECLRRVPARIRQKSVRFYANRFDRIHCLEGIEPSPLNPKPKTLPIMLQTIVCTQFFNTDPWLVFSTFKRLIGGPGWFLAPKRLIRTIHIYINQRVDSI